jgi:hypothetical protein
MSELHTIEDDTTVNQENAALAARLVQRHCGPDAALVLAILGLDKPVVPAPDRQPGPRVAPNPFRRPTAGRRRR